MAKNRWFTFHLSSLVAPAIGKSCQMFESHQQISWVKGPWSKRYGSKAEFGKKSGKKNISQCEWSTTPFLVRKWFTKNASLLVRVLIQNGYGSILKKYWTSQTRSCRSQNCFLSFDLWQTMKWISGMTSFLRWQYLRMIFEVGPVERCRKWTVNASQIASKSARLVNFWLESQEQSIQPKQKTQH